MSVCMCVWLWVMDALAGPVWAEVGTSCKMWGTSLADSIYQQGDVVIGGLFPIHMEAPTPDRSFTHRRDAARCQRVNLRAYRWLQAMIFTVEEINRDPTLLPNLTLGYLYTDTCLVELTTLAAALALVAGQEGSVTARRCRGAPHVPVVIGAASSSASIAVADTLGVFDIPMVSYFASCACLSDKHRYPTFLRTVSNDANQAKGMARLLEHLGWTWVGVVSGDDEYGKSGTRLLLQELQHSSVCVAYHEVIPKTRSPARIQRLAERIRGSTARVVLVFAISPDVEDLLKEAMRQNISDRQWIASEAWSTAYQLAVPQNLPKLAGTIGFALRRADLPGLGRFLTQLRLRRSTEDPLVGAVWETLFGCSLLGNGSARPRCTGEESVEAMQSIYSDVSQLRVTYNVYKAVYAIANAIQDMLTCQPGSGPFENGECPSVSRVKPKQLLHYLRAVNFSTPVGEAVHFDAHGDPADSYDIINWHVGAEGAVGFVQVGRFQSSRGSGKDLTLDVGRVVWGGGWDRVVPVSVCSESCPPGTRKAVQKGKPICCFDCLPCPAGEISNTTGATECTRCPARFWSNAVRTRCIPKLVEFLSFQETMGIILSVLSVTGATLTICVLAMFFRHRDTPLVRANNSELSFLLLLSLALCFLCALVFIGRPAPWSCMLQQTLFGVSFVVCISCVLSKTMVVLVAFRATLPGRNPMRYFGPVQQRAGILICTLVQVVICVLWLALAPPQPSEKQGLDLGAKVVLECTAGSVVGFSLVLGYIGLLASLCFLLAFLARKLPDNFNEAKFITFSMIIFCAVWIAFVPAYVSSPGKYTVAVEIFAILASSYGLLLCIFTPKCYIILLRPEKNTKRNMMAK